MSAQNNEKLLYLLTKDDFISLEDHLKLVDFIVENFSEHEISTGTEDLEFYTLRSILETIVENNIYNGFGVDEDYCIQIDVEHNPIKISILYLNAPSKKTSDRILLYIKNLNEKLK